MPIKVTRRASEIEYAIRDVIVHTKDLIRNGKKIYYLNIGDPAAFDFKTPPSLKEALCRAIAKEDNYYSPSEGLPELRQEWVPYIIVVGEKEVESGTLSVRIRGQNEKETLTAEQLIVKVSEKIAGKPFKPLPLPMYLSKRPQFHG